MLLARWLADYPTELRADLQRYFGLSLDHLGDGVGALQAASCAACLPAGAATLARIDSMHNFDTTQHLLFALLRVLTGGKAAYPWEDGAGGRTDELPELGPLPIDEFEAWYAQEWKDIDGTCQVIAQEQPT